MCHARSVAGPALAAGPGISAWQDGLTFWGERKCTLLLEAPDSEVLTKDIVMADFIVPLAYLVRAAKVFVAAGMLAKEKYLRVIVNELPSAIDVALQIYVGDREFPKFGLSFSKAGETRQDDVVSRYRDLAKKLVCPVGPGLV